MLFRSSIQATLQALHGLVSCAEWTGVKLSTLLDEAGIADAPMTSWQGLAGPGGLPEPMLRRINTEIVRLFNEPEFGKFLVSQGLDNLVGTPEAFAAFMRKDRAEAGEVIRRFNIPRE